MGIDDIGKVQTTSTYVSYVDLIALSHFLTLPVGLPVSRLDPSGKLPGPR